jgi:acyl-CoA synthetase (AMP-forming)/AMP-acid ligase II/acyl carrier protein
MGNGDNLRAVLLSLAQQDPAAPAIAGERGPMVSRGDLAGLLIAAEQHLRRLGLRHQDRVAVLMPQGLEGALVALQVACACSLAPLRPGLQLQQWPALLTRLAPAALVLTPGLAPELAAAAEFLGLPLIDPSDLLRAEHEPRAMAGGSDGPANVDQAVVIATSGSTGLPKLVNLQQVAVLRGCRAMAHALQLTPTDRTLLALPLHHTHGLVSGLLMPLLTGGSVVVAEHFSAQEVLTLLQQQSISWVSLPPAMHQALLDEQRLTPLVKGHRLRFLRSGAISMPWHLRDSLQAAFGVPVIEAYGMSECPHISTNPIEAPRLGSVGLSVVEHLAILGADGTLLPPGEWGEVAVRGAPLMEGYLPDPESDDSLQPMSNGNDWFRTGDQGRLDADGYLYLRGRLCESVNRGGLKLMPAVVDSALLSHPDVREAVTFAVPHPTLGVDLAAAVVLRTDAGLDEQELRAHVFSVLLPHEVPSRILFLEELPRGATGKIQRIGLAEQLADALRSPDEPAVGELEELVAAVIADVLDLKSPGRDANFFLLGGDSLSGTRVITRLAEHLRLDLQPTLLFTAPTVRTLAERLDRLLDETIAQLEGTQ